MRFLLLGLTLCVSLSHPSLADVPVPAQKPGQAQSTFQQVIDNVVESIGVIEKSESNDIIKPPALPESKQADIVVAASIDAESGIPIPDTKPLKIITYSPTARTITADNLDKTNGRQIIYYEGNNEDRTAGGHRQPRGPERVYAEKIGRLKETQEDSPFANSRLPVASKESYQDPIIIFFKERSPELEVGQMSIIKDEVLSPLKRSKSLKAVIYGYAMKDKSSPDATRRLSLSRALMIREYLVDNRIDPDQIEVRTMGDDTPIDPKNRVDIVIQ